MLTPDQFPLILAALSDREAGWFANALTAMEKYENEGLVQKDEFADLKSTFNRAFEKSWSKHMREPFLNAGRWENLSSAEYKFENSMGYPQCHTSSGMLKRLVPAPKGAMRDAMIKIMKECVLIAVRVQALKDKIGKRAPAMTKTRQAEIDRSAKAMHCQICGCDVLAETGVIAHHGYQRPGEGWQTASCHGARELPFETDRAALGVYIEALKERKIGTEAALVAVRAETVDLRWTYNDYSQKRPRWERQPEVSVTVNRANFEERLAEARARFSGKGVTFDQLKSGKIIELTTLTQSLHIAIVRQTKRFEGWAKTHDWDGAGWVPMFHLEPAPIISLQIVADDDDWQFS